MNFNIRVLKRILMCIAFLGIIYSSYGQDLIYKKDKSILKAKILEVTENKIKFKKYEILEGPTFELSLKDVAKIKYYNGFEEVYDTSYSVSNNSNGKNDTSSFAMIYMVYYHGNEGSEHFPIYFNEKKIMTLNGNMRLKYKIFSEGKLVVERRSKSIGPSIVLNIQHGKSYYLYIDILNQYSTDYNKKMALRLVSDEMEVEKYKAYFNFRLNAYKSDTKFYTEDRADPIIK